MHIFVTGATGWVGKSVVDDLLAHGHHVVGLSRSEEKGKVLRAKGVEVVYATLDDLDALRNAVKTADAVIHLAFDHDFSRMAENAAQDKRAIEAMGEALLGTDKLLLVTSGMAMISPGRPVTETDVPPAGPAPRQSEESVRALAAKGVRAASVRLAGSVHGVGDTNGLISRLIDVARRTAVSAYIGEGKNRWAGVHVSDAGPVYRLALETGVTELVYHAVDEEGVTLRDLAEVIGRKYGLPVESRGADHFGEFAMFAGVDMPASSAQTREVLNWHPTGPDLLSDLAKPDYYPGN
ncbi:SDR family oxidoreductase [Serratia proteamaculans]